MRYDAVAIEFCSVAAATLLFQDMLRRCDAVGIVFCSVAAATLLFSGHA